MYRRQPHNLKIRLLRRDFHTFIRNALFRSPIDVRSHNPPPLGPNVLVGSLVSDSRIICNSLSPPLADIVRFDPLCVVVSLTVLNTSASEGFPYFYKEHFSPLFIFIVCKIE